MVKQILLKGGYLLDPAQNWEGPQDLLLEDGRVKEVAAQIPRERAETCVEVNGKVVTPGFIDMHVHLREPGEEEKETVYSGTSAAVAGGVTAVGAMPNTQPAMDNPQTVKYLQDRIRRSAQVRVYPLGTITQGRKGEELSNYASLLASGVKAFSDDGLTVAQNRIMYQAFQYLKKFQGLIISHCEDPQLSEGGEAHEGYWANLLGIPGLPEAAEVLAVARDVLLAKATRGRLHLAHISSAESLKWIKWAREEGVDVTAEVTPHHLLLDDSMLQGFNPMAKMRPPLRTEEDRWALVEALEQGVIDVLATDHAPHCQEDKCKDFQGAANGVSGLEIALPLVITNLVKPGHLSWSRLVECFSLKPAQRLKVPGGTLAPGSPADVTVLDLEKESRIDSSRFYSQGRNTPFEGYSLQGMPVMTIVGGEIKMENGKVYREATSP